jgi:GH25 family lysozyme M1 (1,4-beta-N-acetylmuramidase)
MTLAEIPYTGKHRSGDVAYAAGEDRSGFQRAGLPWTGSAFGFTKTTEDLDFVDEAFQANWAVLLDEGKVRGAYHFLHPAANPAAQARFFVDTVDARGGFRDGDMFACDSEITAGDQGQEVLLPDRMRRMACPLRAQGPMAGTVGELTLEFLEELASLVGPACPVLLYSYLAMATSTLAGCSRYPLYVADYSARPPSSVAPWRTWTFWQNADSGGQGGGDTDRFNGDEAALLAWVGSYSWTEAILAELPTIIPGARDPIGGMNMVLRVKALAAAIGAKNGLGVKLPVNGTYDAGVPKGTIGPDQRAIRTVQGFFGLAEDGEIGPDTWRKLILG